MNDRELRPTAAAGGMAVLAGLTWWVWSTTALRLALFVCVAAVTVAVVDLFWAQLATRKVTPKVLTNPGEATVGGTLTIGLAVGGSHQFVRVAVRSLATSPQGLELPATATFSGEATTRQVLGSIDVEVVSPGVAGLVACARYRRVQLARPLFVGPRPLPAAEPFPELFRTWGEGEARPAPTGDLVRGVRPYQPGDPRRRVHWRATARVGDLVVKEVDEIGAPRLVVALDMGAGGDAGERAAGRAAWYALEGLRRGYQVALVTREPDGGTVAGAVTSPFDVTRRLAAAARGAPELPTNAFGHAAGIAFGHAAGLEPGAMLLITDHGDAWR